MEPGLRVSVQHLLPRSPQIKDSTFSFLDIKKITDEIYHTANQAGVSIPLTHLCCVNTIPQTGKTGLIPY